MLKMTPGDIFDIQLEGVRGYATSTYFESKDRDIGCAVGTNVATIFWRSMGAYIVGGPLFKKSLEACGTDLAEIKALAWDKMVGSITSSLLANMMRKAYECGMADGRKECQDEIKDALGIE